MTPQRITIITALALAGAVATTHAPRAAAQDATDVQAVPYGAIYDHGYVRLKLDNHQEQVDGVFTDRGWHLVVRKARVVGEGLPRRSALLFTLKQGDNELGRVRCELRSESYNYETPWQGASNCQDRDQRILAGGMVDLEVRFVDGDKNIRGYKPLENARAAGDAYTAYLREGMATSYLIGAFWCNPVDSTGGFQKSGIKQGFFDKGLAPRPGLIEAIREFNKHREEITPKG